MEFLGHPVLQPAPDVPIDEIGDALGPAPEEPPELADGEKFVTRTAIFAGDVIVGSFTPATDDPGDPAFDPCTSRGSANLYDFDLVSGEGTARDVSNNPVRAVSIGAGMPTDPKVSVGVGGKENRIIIEKSGTDIESKEADDVNINGGILYWKERL